MNVKELLDSGSLAPAIERLDAELRSKPTDLRLRTSLFELLGFAGDWVRAERQLDAIGRQGDGPEALAGVGVYRYLLEAEKAREALFRKGQPPRFTLEPPPAVSLHLEALDLLRTGHAAEARAALLRAEELRRP